MGDWCGASGKRKEPEGDNCIQDWDSQSRLLVV